VRPGDPWCTLCWTDLRPKPAPPPPPPPPPAPAPVVAYAAPVAYAVAPAAVPTGAPVDPLTAPLAAVLGQPLAADPNAPRPTWPCVECGTANEIERSTCGTCTAPFGGRIARLDDARGQRRKILIVALSAVGLFLLLLGAITFASTPEPRHDPAPIRIDGG
jgi:hypothetical protein